VNNYSFKMKMLTNNTKKILNHLLRNLDLKNVNQVSKELKISVGSSFKILKSLETEEMVFSEKIGNGIYYKLNFNNSELVKVLELILIEQRKELKGFSKIYGDELSKFNCPLIILFGSILKGKKFNDVDVLFSDCSSKRVSEFCLEISKVKSRPVVPLILKSSDLVKEIKAGKDSILSLIKSGVVLRGESEFLEVIKNAKS
jgi:predicted nucleotidyltransferase